MRLKTIARATLGLALIWGQAAFSKTSTIQGVVQVELAPDTQAYPSQELWIYLPDEWFVFSPVPIFEIREKVYQKNKDKAGPIPDTYDHHESCPMSYINCPVDYGSYRDAYDTWHKKAYRGFPKTLRQAIRSTGRSLQFYKTDAKGKLHYNLPPGQWYISGWPKRSSGFLNYFWRDVFLNLGPQPQVLWLTRGNADSIIKMPEFSGHYGQNGKLRLWAPD